MSTTRRAIGVTTIAVAISAFLVGCGDGSSDDPSGEEGESSVESQAPVDAEATEEPPAEAAAFDPLEVSGTGADVVGLPDGAEVGIVTATHDGSANFVLTTLDAANQQVDLLVNVIGPYSGVTAFGLMGFGEPPTSIQVQADGAWTLTIAPESAAPELTLPANGTGDSVLRYVGPAATVTFTHEGEMNFVVTQYGDLPNLLINEIGPYSGSVPMTAGPTLVTINADGTWSAAEG